MTILATTLIEKQRMIESKLDELHIILNSAKKGAFGLTLDESKTPEWKKAKQDHAVYFKMYQNVNQSLNKIREAVGFENVNGKRVTIYKYK